MRMSTVFTTTIGILKAYSKEHPNVVIEEDGTTIKTKDLISSLNKLLGWLYKDLTTESIERVVHCYDCRYYKKYKKRGSLKSASFYACSQDRKRRRPDFYCKDGERKCLE